MQLKIIGKESTNRIQRIFYFTSRQSQSLISSFRREVDENCAILGYYTAKKGPIGCPETSVRNYYYSLLNNPEERSSQQSQNISAV
jgi:hypothetical protein